MMLSIIILAAGRGKRMSSKLPKVLHPLAGKPILEHVLQTAEQLSENIFVVYGHEGEQVKQNFSHHHITWVEQTEMLGTGHAVLQALPALQKNTRVLVMPGDVPLIHANTLQRLLTEVKEDALGVLTATVDNPYGLGRIIRDENKNIKAIVEEKDANEKQRLIHEINTGFIVAPFSLLEEGLPQLENVNGQKEYYLPDIVDYACRKNMAVQGISAANPEEILGVNEQCQLAQLERLYQKQSAKKLMKQGVLFYDPARFDLRGDAEIGAETMIDVNVILEGQVIIGRRCRIGPNCYLRDVKIEDDVEILANSVIEEAEIGPQCRIGPFARIRPGTTLAKEVHVGNFVEVKKSKVASSSKINHLSYIGDAIIGEDVNIGAGTITCNYDGVNKFETLIGDHVFVGSHTALVAPVTIGEYATLGAGSTITSNAPPHKLSLSRAKQVTVPGWTRPKKKEKKTDE